MAGLTGVRCGWWCVVLVLSGTGCPFVFGPPDLSKVDIVVTDGDSGTEVTTPTVDTEDTGTAPTFDVPTVVDFQLKRFVDKLGFAFSVVDTDDDFVSGKVTFMSDVEGSAPLIYTIPGDLDLWEPLARSVVTVPQDWLPCDGLTEKWTITVTDAAGHVGPPVEAELRINGLGLVQEGNLYDFGWLGETTVACVEFNADPLNPDPIQNQLQLDREDLRFVAVSSGTYAFELAWQNVMDADSRLLTRARSSRAADGPGRTCLGVLPSGTWWPTRPTSCRRSTTSVRGNEPPYVGTLLMGPADE